MYVGWQIRTRMITSRISKIVINNSDYGSSDSLVDLCMYIIGHNKNQAALNRLCWFVGESVTSIEIIFYTGYFIGYYDQIHTNSKCKQNRNNQALNSDYNYPSNHLT